LVFEVHLQGTAVTIGNADGTSMECFNGEINLDWDWSTVR